MLLPDWRVQKEWRFRGDRESRWGGCRKKSGGLGGGG